jgi:hydroxyethylthiazole kinase-like uncharacterized protein yjeF
MQKLTKSFIRTSIKIRNMNAHKGNFGHALLIAENVNKIGAAVIGSKACLRSGAGLLTVNIPKEERLAMQVSIPEAMICFRENKSLDYTKFSAIAIGPGIGVEKNEIQLLKNILHNTNLPLVLDADALNIISANKSLMKLIPRNTIITPHPKEFDRLFGAHISDIERRKTAIIKAKEYHIIIVLKGHETLICSAKKSFINTTGNAGLAKGGAGDALTGMILAFLAQGYEPEYASLVGVYLHGLSADISIKQQSIESLLITDVIENIGQAFHFVHQ